MVLCTTDTNVPVTTFNPIEVYFSCILKNFFSKIFMKAHFYGRCFCLQRFGDVLRRRGAWPIDIRIKHLVPYCKLLVPSTQFHLPCFYDDIADSYSKPEPRYPFFIFSWQPHKRSIQGTGKKPSQAQFTYAEVHEDFCGAQTQVRCSKPSSKTLRDKNAPLENKKLKWNAYLK